MRIIGNEITKFAAKVKIGAQSETILTAPTSDSAQPETNTNGYYKYSVNNRSGQTKFDIVDTQDVLKWLRLSNGMYALCQNVGIALDRNPARGEDGGGFASNKPFEGTGGTNPIESVGTGGEGADTLWRWSKIVRFEGRNYKVRVMSIGINAEELAKSDVGMYILPTNGTLDQWHLKSQNIFTDCRGERSGTYKDDSFRGIVKAGADGLTTEFKQYAYNNNVIPTFSFRLMMVPSDPYCAFKTDETDLGGIIEPKTFTLETTGDGTVDIHIDNTSVGSVLAESNRVTVNLSDYWNTLSYGAHTMKLIGTLNGYNPEAIVRFEKRATSIIVTGKPYKTDKMVRACSYIDSSVIPSGAVKTIKVCNNGLDESPTWETYTDNHVFANKEKTADNWAINWMVYIDNTNGTSNAELQNAIAMGVVY